MVKELPIYKIKGKYYYRDERLNEYRNIHNPSDTQPLNAELDKPIEKDKDEVWRKAILKTKRGWY